VVLLEGYNTHTWETGAHCCQVTTNKRLGLERRTNARPGLGGEVGWSRVRWGQGTLGGWVVITELPEGYNTLVGDRGTLLSSAFFSLSSYKP
jgi:hypothetical protein